MNYYFLQKSSADISPRGPWIRQEQHHRKCQIAYLLKEKMLQCHRPSQAFARWFLKCARLGFGPVLVFDLKALMDFLITP